MPFVEVDIDAIIKEECKDPEFKREFEKVEEKYNKPNTSKKRYKAMDRAIRIRK